MSIATIVTRGYGLFSTVDKVLTRGYSIGAVVLIVEPDNALYIPFRDKRLAELRRDNRMSIAWRDKRKVNRGN